jgi:hypothetical protein
MARLGRRPDDRDPRSLAPRREHVALAKCPGATDVRTQVWTSRTTPDHKKEMRVNLKKTDPQPSRSNDNETDLRERVKEGLRRLAAEDEAAGDREEDDVGHCLVEHSDLDDRRPGKKSKQMTVEARRMTTIARLLVWGACHLDYSVTDLRNLATALSYVLEMLKEEGLPNRDPISHQHLYWAVDHLDDLRVSLHAVTAPIGTFRG